MTTSVNLIPSTSVHFSVNGNRHKAGSCFSVFTKPSSSTFKDVQGWVDIKNGNKRQSWGQQFAEAPSKKHALHLKPSVLSPAPWTETTHLALPGSHTPGRQSEPPYTFLLPARRHSPLKVQEICTSMNTSVRNWYLGEGDKQIQELYDFSLKIKNTIC